MNKIFSHSRQLAVGNRQLVDNFNAKIFIFLPTVD